MVMASLPFPQERDVNRRLNFPLSFPSQFPRRRRPLDIDVPMTPGFHAIPSERLAKLASLARIGLRFKRAGVSGQCSRATIFEFNKRW